MHIGLRKKTLWPLTYKGFHVVRSHGRIYGIPSFLTPEDLHHHGRPYSHPAILSAATWQELEAQIDGQEASSPRPEVVGSYKGYNLVAYRDSVCAVPQTARCVDLEREADRRRAGVIRGETLEQ